MINPIEVIKISEKGRHQLIRLKQNTGIKNWNILCRWAFCISLAEKTKPAYAEIEEYSNIEMIWKVFGGKNSDIYFLLLVQRVKEDGIELNDSNLQEQFKLHIHRGLSYLSATKRVKDINSLLKEAIA